MKDTMFHYPVFSTTVRYQHAELLEILYQISAGIDVSGSLDLHIFYMDYLLALDSFSTRRMCKSWDRDLQSGKHVAIMAAHRADFAQLTDPYLRQWLNDHCLMFEAEGRGRR